MVSVNADKTPTILWIALPNKEINWNPKKMNEFEEYYVYLYRDARTLNPVYVGQGKNIGRSKSHQMESHNLAFDEWLKCNEHNIEIVGPLGTKELADRIETALISTIQPSKASKLFNIHKGVSQFRFRPFGVPEKYIDRIESTINRQSLNELVAINGKILFVINNGKNFDDSRVGYDLLTPPSDDQIRARIEKWWQLANRRNTWITDQSLSPGLLIGVHGSPGQQIIIGACEIDKKGWGEVLEGGQGLISIPLKHQSLDAFALRGKKISMDIGLKFGSFRHQQFRIFNGIAFEAKHDVI